MHRRIPLGFFVMIGGCVTAPALAPDAPVAPAELPEQYAFDRKWSSNSEGYTFSVGYFTPEQEASSAWEEARLASRNMAEVCEEKRLLRRQVRWLEPTTPGGPRCAKVVYSYSCVPRDLNVKGSLEYDAAQALLEEPTAPPGPDCGEKDRTKLPPNDRGSLSVRGHLLRANVSCKQLTDETRGTIHLRDVTYLNARSLYAPQYVSAGHALPNNLAGRLSYAASIEGTRHIVEVERRLARDADNIFLDQVFTPYGDGYCVTLVARQGDSLWRRTMLRDFRTTSTRRLPDGSPEAPLPQVNWSPHDDLRTLMDRLIEYLGLPVPPPPPEA